MKYVGWGLVIAWVVWGLDYFDQPMVTQVLIVNVAILYYMLEKQARRIDNLLATIDRMNEQTASTWHR